VSGMSEWLAGYVEPLNAEIATLTAQVERQKEELRLAYVEIINMTTPDEKIKVFERILAGRAEYDRKQQEQPK